MTLARGRLIRPEPGANPVLLRPQGARLSDSADVPAARAVGRVIRRELYQAAAQAKAVCEQAEQRARALVEQAEREAAEIRLQSELRGRADAAARVASHQIAWRIQVARAEERALDRVAELAPALAERLLGEALQLDPSRVIALARQLLRETQASGCIRLYSNPHDAEVLMDSLDALGCDAGVLRIIADPRCSRGNLRLETEAGVFDADLSLQLGRLVQQLRKAMTP